MKICINCLLEKPLADFHKHKNYPDGYRNTCKACIKPYSKAYYVRHREQLLHKMSLYAETNKEQIRTYKAAWYQERSEELKARARARRKAAPDIFKAKDYAYKKTHRDMYLRVQAAAHKRRRAKKAGALLNDFSAAQWRELQEQFDHCCAYCGKRAKGHLTQDHITPISKGGMHTLGNIVPACRACNSKKRDKEPLSPVQPLLLTLAKKSRSPK